MLTFPGKAKRSALVCHSDLSSPFSQFCAQYGVIEAEARFSMPVAGGAFGASRERPLRRESAATSGVSLRNRVAPVAC